MSSTTTDPTPANNTATDDTTVVTSADLSIAKTDSPDPVIAGTNLTYTLTVSNGGPSDALGVSVSDTLPAGTSFVSSSPSQGTCSGTIDRHLQPRHDRGRRQRDDHDRRQRRLERRSARSATPPR